MKYKLSEIGEVIGGGTPSTKNDGYYSRNGIGWITPKDLSGYNEMYIYHGSRDISDLGLKNSSAKLLPPKTILISSRAPIGYVAISGDYLATNQGFKSIIPNVDKILPEFLYYLMIVNKERLKQIASGSTFKEVSGKVMKNFVVDIPEINRQKKILKKILPISKKIELNQKINDNLLKSITVIWKEYQNYKGRKTSLKDLSLNIITGKTPSTQNKANYGNDILFVKIPDMHGKIFITNTGQKLSKIGADSQSKKYIPANSIMVSCIGTPGLVSLTDREVQTNQQINSVIIKPRYLYYVFISLRELKNKIGILGSGGTTIKNLNKSDFSNIEILLPNEEKLELFNKFVSPMFDCIHNNIIQSEKLNAIRIILLSKFF